MVCFYHSLHFVIKNHHDEPETYGQSFIKVKIKIPCFKRSSALLSNQNFVNVLNFAIKKFVAFE